MKAIDEFRKIFNGLAIPVELMKLLDFENNVSKNQFYSSGFELKLSKRNLV